MKVALIHVGKFLIHTPEDQNGLWINRVVAAALNDRDAKAKKVENEGFQRLTDTLRDVLNVYDKEAERIISEFEKPTS